MGQNDSRDQHKNHLRLAAENDPDCPNFTPSERLDYIVEMLDSIGKLAAASKYGLMSWLIVQASIEGRRIKSAMRHPN